MVIIVKDFVRNFKVVKLHEHTIKLCELAGFVLKEVLLFKLPQKSFWRILYQKKYGSKVKDLNLLDYEWVLVFEKPKKIIKLHNKGLGGRRKWMWKSG